MKFMRTQKKLIQRFATIFSMLFMSISTAQIANNYPNDIGIENDAQVVFTEMFEEISIGEMYVNSNWTDTSNTNSGMSMIAFGSTVPSGSLGTQSLRLTTVEGVSSNEDTYLFKRFSPGYNDSLFVRCYIKYNTASTFHHSGIWIGGNNPPTSWPGNQSGTLPDGDQGFHIGTEVRGATMSAQTFADFGFYNYWMSMHQSNQSDGMGGYYYWGNEFISPDPEATINMSEWVCVEVMIKLNNPLTSSNGEIALWIDGVQVGHYGENFPTGTWNYSDFTEGAGIPFEGFQFRFDAALNLNYIWLKNYATTNNPLGLVNDMYFDHLVVAKSYIGPIYADASASEIKESTELKLFPNPSTGKFNLSFSEEIQNGALKIHNQLGQIVFEKQNLSGSFFEFNVDLPNGMYEVVIVSDEKYLSKKLFLE